MKIIADLYNNKILLKIKYFVKNKILLKIIYCKKN
jgi:hypothetical protein